MERGPGHHPGGISGLYRLLREHGEAVEADLQRVYHVDLRDLATGALSWRRLRVLVDGIYGESKRWGPTEHLLADAVNALRSGNWQRGGGKGRRPQPVERPGHRPGTRRFGTGRYSIEHMQKLLNKANRGVSDDGS